MTTALEQARTGYVGAFTAVLEFAGKRAYPPLSTEEYDALGRLLDAYADARVQHLREAELDAARFMDRLRARAESEAVAKLNGGGA